MPKPASSWCSAKKKVTDYELTARARDGKKTVVSYNATTFYDRDRKLQGVFAAARDVTERKRLDQALQEKNVELEGVTAAAEKANLAKSDFLSSMSHELRSPLNAILGFSQLMESDTPPPTPSQKESISQILQAGWHLLTLINEILDLAKVESGQMPLVREPVSLAEVLRECHGMIHPQTQQRDIRMVFPRLDSPHFVYADRTRLKQVLMNLLSNAVKYNVTDGKVAVACAESAPGHTRVSVRDTGAGLDPEQLAQLFRPFNRLGQEGGSEEGTGIGLVVSVHPHETWSHPSPRGALVLVHATPRHVHHREEWGCCSEPLPSDTLPGDYACSTTANAHNRSSIHAKQPKP